MPARADGRWGEDGHEAAGGDVELGVESWLETGGVVDSRAAPEVGNRDHRRRSAPRRDRRYRPARLPRRLDGTTRDARSSDCRSSRLARGRSSSTTQSAARPRAWAVGLAGAGGRRLGSTSRPRARPAPALPQPWPLAQVALARHRFRAAARRRPARSPDSPSSRACSAPSAPAAVAGVPWQTHRPPPRELRPDAGAGYGGQQPGVVVEITGTTLRAE